MRSSLRPISPPLIRLSLLAPTNARTILLMGGPNRLRCRWSLPRPQMSHRMLEPQPAASIRDGDRDPDTQEGAASTLSKADPAMDTAEATGSAMASAHGVVKVSPADTSEAVAAETVSASPDSGSTAADQQPETAAVLSPEA